jgi:hypothetical protein
MSDEPRRSWRGGRAEWKVLLLLIAVSQTPATAGDAVAVRCEVTAPWFHSYPELASGACDKLIAWLRADAVYGLWTYVDVTRLREDARKQQVTSAAASLTFSVARSAPESSETAIQLTLEQEGEKAGPWQSTWIAAGADLPARSQAAGQLEEALVERLSTSPSPWRKGLLQSLRPIPVGTAEWVHAPSLDDPDPDLSVRSSVQWRPHHRFTKFLVDCPRTKTRSTLLVSAGESESGPHGVLVVVVEGRLGPGGREEYIEDPGVLRAVIQARPQRLRYHDDSGSSVPTP